MSAPEYAVVGRDIQAIEIPQGDPVPLPEGTHVRIMQSLGGTYTVMTEYGQLLRIGDKDVDAIGKQPPPDAPEAPGEGAPVEEQVWAQLRTCFDPEIPVNIVDLGLVYNCEVSDLPEGGKKVAITMTLTAPGCGMGPVLANDVKQKVEGIAGVKEADVEVVFDPQWNPNMMTEAARLQLGFF